MTKALPKSWHRFAIMTVGKALPLSMVAKLCHDGGKALPSLVANHGKALPLWWQSFATNDGKALQSFATNDGKALPLRWAKLCHHSW